MGPSRTARARARRRRPHLSRRRSGPHRSQHSELHPLRHCRSNLLSHHSRARRNPHGSSKRARPRHRSQSSRSSSALSHRPRNRPRLQHNHHRNLSLSSRHKLRPALVDHPRAKTRPPASVASSELLSERSAATAWRNLAGAETVEERLLLKVLRLSFREHQRRRRGRAAGRGRARRLAVSAQRALVGREGAGRKLQVRLGTGTPKAVRRGDRWWVRPGSRPPGDGQRRIRGRRWLVLGNTVGLQAFRRRS